MIPKSGHRFSEKIMLKQKDKAGCHPTVTHPALAASVTKCMDGVRRPGPRRLYSRSKRFRHPALLTLEQGSAAERTRACPPRFSSVSITRCLNDRRLGYRL